MIFLTLACFCSFTVADLSPCTSFPVKVRIAAGRTLQASESTWEGSTTQQQIKHSPVQLIKVKKILDLHARHFQQERRGGSLQRERFAKLSLLSVHPASQTMSPKKKKKKKRKKRK
jgi:hypothetical protein